ncbi:MAG: hypothetical protein ACRD2B_11320 [Terriglobia bacterium]
MRKYFGITLALLTLLSVLACGNSGRQTANQEAAQGQQAPQTRDTAAPVPVAAKQKAPAPPPVTTYTVPAGTALRVRLNDSMSTATATAGTPFSGTLSEPLVADGIVVAPAGSAVSGRVTGVDRGGRLHHPPAISLVLTSLKPAGGVTVAISTREWSERGKSHTKRNAETIGGGGGLGALIGGLAGHGKGAGIGALVGAAAGTAGAAFTGQKQIVLREEVSLRFVLSQPVTFTRRAP